MFEFFIVVGYSTWLLTCNLTQADESRKTNGVTSGFPKLIKIENIIKLKFVGEGSSSSLHYKNQTSIENKRIVYAVGSQRPATGGHCVDNCDVSVCLSNY